MHSDFIVFDKATQQNYFLGRNIIPVANTEIKDSMIDIAFGHKIIFEYPHYVNYDYNDVIIRMSLNQPNHLFIFYFFIINGVRNIN